MVAEPEKKHSMCLLYFNTASCFSVTHLVRLQGLALHIEVPDFGSQVVSGEQIAAAVAELDVRHRGDDLREKGAGAGVLGLLKHWRGWQRKGGERRAGV